MIRFFEKFGIPRVLLLGFLAVAIFMTGDGQFLRFVKRHSGGLFPIAEGGVHDFYSHVFPKKGHIHRLTKSKPVKRPLFIY